MNVNATLLFELVLFFLLFYWVKLKVWPVFIGVLEKRQSLIAKGLSDAKEAEEKLDHVRLRSAGILDKAKNDAKTIIDQARTESKQMLLDTQKHLNELKARHQADLDAQVKGVLDEAKGELHDVLLASCVEVLQKALPRLSSEDKTLQKRVLEAVIEEGSS